MGRRGPDRRSAEAGGPPARVADIARIATIGGRLRVQAGEQAALRVAPASATGHRIRAVAAPGHHGAARDMAVVQPPGTLAVANSGVDGAVRALAVADARVDRAEAARLSARARTVRASALPAAAGRARAGRAKRLARRMASMVMEGSWIPVGRVGVGVGSAQAPSWRRRGHGSRGFQSRAAAIRFNAPRTFVSAWPAAARPPAPSSGPGQGGTSPSPLSCLFWP